MFYRFLSQNMAANEPEKNIPSTAAKATTRSPNPACIEYFKSMI